jgi:hypothetical protein
MPFPAYWPAANDFNSLDNILQGANNPLPVLQGINSFLQNYPAQNPYTVAPLDDQSQMWQVIGTEVSNTLPHGAGWKHDKYGPARWWKNTPAGPGQTKKRPSKSGLVGSV